MRAFFKASMTKTFIELYLYNLKIIFENFNLKKFKLIRKIRKLKKNTYIYIFKCNFPPSGPKLYLQVVPKNTKST